LRDAKATIPEATIAALNDKELPARPVELTVASNTPNFVNVKPKVVAADRRSEMNISVRDGNRTRENGVLVIRPKITVIDGASAPETLTIASSVPVNDRISSAQVISVPQTRQLAQVSDRIVSNAGPRFIFEN